MSTFECPLVEYSLEKHPNADTLSIAHIKGWQCVVKTEEFQGLEVAVYIPIDAVAPADHELLGFLEGKKVKTIKLRQVISQGLLLPIADVLTWCKKNKKQVPELEIGTDFAEILGVKKYVQEREKEPSVTTSYYDSYLKEWEYPSEFNKYTDIEHLNNWPDVIKEGTVVYVTEKLHGTSVRYGLINGAYYVGTRNRVLRTLPYVSNRRRIKWERRSMWQIFKDWFNGVKLEPQWPAQTVWHKVFYETNLNIALMKLAAKLGPSVTLFGEIVGPGVQDLKYGLTKPLFFAYDIKVGNHYLPPEAFILACKDCGIPTVPVLCVSQFNQELVRLFTQGKETVSGTQAHVREGIVIEPQVPAFENRLGRVILKSVNPEYHMRKNSTDFVE